MKFKGIPQFSIGLKDIVVGVDIMPLLLLDSPPDVELANDPRRFLSRSNKRLK
jgi:hypothetical protein